MKISNYFKKGILIGSLFSIVTILGCVYKFHQMINKTENVSTFDLNSLKYQDLQQNELLLEKFEGKNVLVNYWATWCGPCVKEFEILQEVYENVDSEFEFVMVSYESFDKIKAFKEKSSFDFTFLKSNNFILEGISTLPQSFILNREGEKVYHHQDIFEGTSKELQEFLYSKLD